MVAVWRTVAFKAVAIPSLGTACQATVSSWQQRNGNFRMLLIFTFKSTPAQPGSRSRSPSHGSKARSGVAREVPGSRDLRANLPGFSLGARADVSACRPWHLLRTVSAATESETKFSPRCGRGSWLAVVHLLCRPRSQPQPLRRRVGGQGGGAGGPDVLRLPLLSPVAGP